MHRRLVQSSDVQQLTRKTTIQLQCTIHVNELGYIM